VSEELMVNGLRVIKNRVFHPPHNGCVSVEGNIDVDEVLNAKIIDAKESITLNGFTFDGVAKNPNQSSGFFVTQEYLTAMIQQTVERVEATMQERIDTAVTKAVQHMTQWQPHNWGPFIGYGPITLSVGSGALGNASEILVYFSLTTNSKTAEQNTFVISTGSGEYIFVSANSDASSSESLQCNSQVFWLPFSTGTISVQPQKSNNTTSYELQIIGYRTRLSTS